jgi:hypothetical protein
MGMRIYKFPRDGVQSFETLTALMRILIDDHFPIVTQEIPGNEIFIWKNLARGQHEKNSIFASVWKYQGKIRVEIDDRATEITAVIDAWHKRRFERQS